MAWFGLGRNAVYYPGCFSLANLKEKIENYKKILKRIGISKSLPEDFNCCSGILINAGYDKQARKVARENLEKFKQQKITKIITNCPLCYKTFSQDYKNFMPDWDIETEHIIITILKELKENPQLIKISAGKEKVIYHDPCYLTRYCDIIDQPRELLNLLGYEVVELALNKKNSLCCGSCSNLFLLNKELGKRLAENYIKQLKRTNIKKIITADPYSYIHLKSYLHEEGIEILELSDVLMQALKIRRFL